MISALLAVVVLAFIAWLVNAAVDLWKWTQRTDEQLALAANIFQLQQEAIRQLQHHAASMERNIVATQVAVSYLAWRLAERGVLTSDDTPADDSVSIN